MARMIRLDPAPKERLPRDGWELVATEAGRYATGLRATLQVWTGNLQGTQQLPLAHPERWDDFITELAGRFYGEQDKAPGTQALQDAITVLEGKALFDGREYRVSTRLAEYEGTIYLDLANGAWEAVEITASGWSVVARPPVKFRRMRGMLPLPFPLRGGRLDDLRAFTNLKDPFDWVLFKAWMVQA
jgi:hypothetical protein